VNFHLFYRLSLQAYTLHICQRPWYVRWISFFLVSLYVYWKNVICISFFLFRWFLPYICMFVFEGEGFFFYLMVRAFFSSIFTSILFFLLFTNKGVEFSSSAHEVVELPKLYNVLFSLFVVLFYLDFFNSFRFLIWLLCCFRVMSMKRNMVKGIKKNLWYLPTNTSEINHMNSFQNN
jgi:hypothetical protein